MTNHVISYLCKHAEHPPPIRPLVVDELTYFYNSKSAPQWFSQPIWKARKILPLFLCPRSPLHPSSTTMPPICCRRLAIGPPTPVPIPILAPAPVTLSNNFFQKFIWTCIKKVQDQALAAPAAPAAEARDITSRPLKPENPDLYYSNSYIECYYFCQ